ncbi:hypothetical protein HCH_06429 [Hahella chejuensis KCTC 2396]|uniref:Uncharacterized protein n=1 Tax=Hahella chejuensis (strain KCTC 2396) TaxID=349521 RepID=Q2S8F0_HAHCH|nr:hypothetical protein HCH_06429 [Hahella chejuensis KCTC 2396]
MNSELRQSGRFQRVYLGMMPDWQCQSEKDDSDEVRRHQRYPWHV